MSRFPRRLLGAALLTLGVLLPAAAQAATPSAGWRLQVLAQPTNFTAARNGECREAIETFGQHIEKPPVALACERYLITARNEGEAPTDGTAVTIRDELPAGLTPVSVARGLGGDGGLAPPLECNVATVTCSFHGVLGAGETLVMTVMVEVESSPAEGSALASSVTVEGGGALPRAESVVNSVSAGQPPFSLGAFGMFANGADGADEQKAGAHPASFTASLAVSSVLSRQGSSLEYLPVESPKNISIELSVGAYDDPLATPLCPENLLGRGECPSASRVGSVAVAGSGSESSGNATLPLFNLVPEPGYAAEFGFEFLEHEVILYAQVIRTAAGSALRVVVPGLPRLFQSLEPQSVTITFYGNPVARNGGSGPEVPFLTNPTDCSAGPLSTHAWADSWQNPGQAVTGEYPTYGEGVTGCNQLEFSPTIRSRPSTNRADSPAGLDFHLEVPQGSDVEGLATPPARDVTVALPAGLTVSPSSVDGLAACQAEGPEGINIGSGDISTEGQDLGDPEATEFGAGHAGGNGSPYDDGLWHTAPGHCPAASQLGTVEVTTPLLDHPLPGRVYLGAPECGPCSNADAAQGKLLKLYIEVNDPRSGTIVKLPGTVAADPSTGQLTATFRDAPQLPFSDLHLHLKEGSRAPLRTPVSCGRYETSSGLSPWSAPETPDAHPADPFEISAPAQGSGCPASEAQQPNAPSFSAGTVDPRAGSYSPFVLKVSREDGNQQIGSIDTTLPEGLLAKLAGVPYCPEAQIAAAAASSGRAEEASPSCPVASRLGSVTVGAGPGPTPYYVNGDAYLAGPYKGAPLSLVIITPAVAGPFDLGTVVVRTALYVEPFSAQIHAVSDPIPQILAGIPLDVRSVAISIDRSQFTRNPTSCERSSVLATSLSPTGSAAALTSPFQVGGCSELGFAPKLKLSLKGPTKRTGHPALKAVLNMPANGANIGRAQVGLPHGEFLDNSNIGTVCTQPQLKTQTCPPASIYGKAKAWSPLLDQPLEGPVYLGAGFGHKLPDLVADLNGQIRVLVHGKVDTDKRGGIRNTFELVPDAPVSKFVLEMQGGKKKGLLVNSENVCRKEQKAEVKFTAQNGKVVTFAPKIANSCKGKHKSKKHGH